MAEFFKNNFTQAAIKQFKRRDFRFITQDGDKDFILQHKALEILTDHQTKEMLLGGAAGGSKSFTAWIWLVLLCISYDGVYNFMAREVLKSLVNFGMMSFREVAEFLRLQKDIDYRYNGQKNIIYFSNGSEIHLIECKIKPTDKELHGLGSSLFTCGVIEEGSQTQAQAYDILSTRINRHKNDEYNLLGKILVTANPSQGYLYRLFYLPDKNKELPKHMCYLPVKANENPYIDSGYLENLDNIKDPITRARLRDGVWDYDNSPNALLTAKQIHSIFSNSHVENYGENYITLDPAGLGQDSCVFIAWQGWQIVEVFELETSTESQIKQVIDRMRKMYHVPAPNVIVDSIGVGHFLVDQFSATGFAASGKAFEPHIYENCKAEAGYNLTDFIDDIFVSCDLPPKTRDDLTQELAQLQTHKSDDDKRLKILPKDHIKKFIGRSPGLLDCVLMRVHAESGTGFFTVAGRT